MMTSGTHFQQRFDSDIGAGAEYGQSLKSIAAEVIFTVAKGFKSAVILLVALTQLPECCGVQYSKPEVGFPQATLCFYTVQ